MLDQTVNSKSISYLLTDNERYIFSSELGLKSESDVVNECVETFNRIQDFDSLDLDIINGKKIFKLKNLNYYLLHKRLNETLKVINQTKQSDRESIIRSIKNLLPNKGRFSILRLDISGFYESISIDRLKELIVDDDVYSNSTKALALKWFKCFEASGASGLPRGLSISSTLSEMYMKSFDERVRLLEGSIFYARFVDDIFIMHSDDCENALERIKRLLPEGIELNSQKKKFYMKNCDFRHVNRDLDFSYLGYRFKSKLINGKTAEVQIGLSEEKISKIKGRISRAMIAYAKDNDFSLLEKRIRFLTCNYTLSSRFRGTKIRSGIFYNYKSLTKMGKNDLRELDRFKNNIIFSDKFRFNMLNSPIHLTLDQKKILAKKSFYYGYVNKVFSKFSVETINIIKRCWK